MNILSNKNACILDIFLNYLRVKHTKVFSSKFYEEHPHKNNLYGLSLMLSEYNVPNTGIQILDKSLIEKIECPFVAHLNGDKFAVVHNISTNNVGYILNGVENSVSINEFNSLCSGTILTAEPNIESIEPNYWENRKNQIIHVGKHFLFVLCALFLVFNTSRKYLMDLGMLTSLMINLFGTYIGYLLLLKQMKFQSSSAEKLCSLFKNSNCNNILESEAARFFGIFSLSEIGFSYFISNTIILLLFPELVICLSIINLFTLIFSIWSIWYQKFKLKQWCPICLIVMSLFWVQFLINILSGSIFFNNIDLFNFLTIVAIYALVFSATSLSVLKLAESQTIDQIKSNYNSIKIDEGVFSSLLKKQPYYEVDKSTSRLLFGNPDANTLITVVSNPLCKSCYRMHSRVEKILAIAGDRVCIQYVFISFKSQDLYTKFLVAIYLQNERKEAERVFGQWFRNGGYNAKEFISQYDYEAKADIVNTECLSHEIWADNAGLNTTPTILLNGYKLPKAYKIEDLILFDI